MQLHSAFMENFCQHRQIFAQFCPGLNAVVGPNGSGKSNLVNGVYAAITGDFGRNPGLKVDNVYQLAGEDEPAYVSVDFGHDDLNISLQRQLRGGRATMVIKTHETEKHLTKISEINDELASILGVSSKIIADYVFVDQWEIFNFLSMIPSERAKAFQRLFKTEQAETIYSTLGKYCDRPVLFKSGIDRDTIAARVSNNRQQLEALVAERAALHVDTDALPSLMTQVTQWDTRQRLLCELAAVQARYDGVLRDTEAHKAEAIAAEKLADSINTEISAAVYMPTQIDELLARWDRFDVYSKERDRLQSSLDTTVALLFKLKQPVKPLNYTPPENCDDKAAVDWWDAHHKLYESVSAARHFITQIDSDSAACPTCGTPKADFAQHRSKYTATFQADCAELDRQLQQIKLSNEYRDNLVKYKVESTRLADMSDSLADRLEKLPVVEHPPLAREDLYRAAYKHNKLSTDLASAKTRADQNRVKHSTTTGYLITVRAELNEKQRAVSHICISEAEATAAKAQIAAINAAQLRSTTLSAKIAAIEPVLRDDIVLLAKIDNESSRTDIEEAWIEHANAIRELLHRDKLPSLVARRNLCAIQAEVNDILFKFDSSFHVTASNDLSFLANFKDGRSLPAARLSGGEKVLLAIAFRVVINSMFAGDLGLLCLDEPTAGLDETNMQCIHVAIDCLRELSKSKGLQIVMVTHHGGFMPQFDNIISLG